jgi:phosphoglycerate dehydrogenase-like enzyme
MRTALKIATQMPLPLLDPVRQRYPEVEIVSIPSEGPVPEDLGAQVLLTMPWGTPNLREVLATGIEWVHAYGTGVNGFPFELLKGVPLTCSRGASAKAISEWVMAVLLAAEKRLPESWLDEPPERWNMAELGSLEGRRLALIGFGGIAQAIARRALPFDMKIAALRRTATPSPIPEVSLVTDLETLLRGADHVVVAAPETPATRHLLNDASLAWMGPGAHLVNIARGGLVDQEALRRALDDGRVALATLDCVEPEPLPAGHWLYSHPRVRLTPHISWAGSGSHAGLMDRFCENLARHLAGEPLDFVVDPEEQY